MAVLNTPAPFAGTVVLIANLGSFSDCSADPDFFGIDAAR